MLHIYRLPFGMVLPIAVLSVVLNGCGAAPPAASSPTAAPAASAPAATPTGATPTARPAARPAAPTAQPAPSAAIQPTPIPSRLPAPLYFLNDQQQIVRLETDGATRTTITQEPNGVAWFAISPRDGSLLYSTDNNGPTTLVRVDPRGGNRTALLKGTIRDMQWAPDGTKYAIWWAHGPQGSGVYLIDADGNPTLMVKDTPFQPGTQTAGRTFAPLAWAPDRTKLLLRTAPDNGPDRPAGDLSGTGLVVADPTGRVTELVQLGSQPFLCSQAFWSIDSAAIYCAQEGYANEAPPLWRIPAAGGVPEVLVPAASGEMVTFYRTLQLGDGGIYGFVSAGPANATNDAFTMQRRNADGADARNLRDDVFTTTAVLPALWADNGSGAIVKDPRSPGDKGLLWMPTDGGAPLALPEAFQLDLHWGAK